MTQANYGIWNHRKFFQGCKGVLRGPDLKAHAGSSRLPLHMLRYWITFNFLRSSITTQHAPKILEVGIDRGQLFFFSKAVDLTVKKWEWEGLDVNPNTLALKNRGYEDIHLVNCENLNQLEQFVSDIRKADKYDAIVALHFLEHLRKPEMTLKLLNKVLKPGGIIVGGMPSCPDFFRKIQERRILKKASSFGHKSVFSHRSLIQTLRTSGLEPVAVSGAFLMRSKGFPLENNSWWFHLNLWFGRAFPRWPGELYFKARKPLQT